MLKLIGLRRARRPHLAGSRRFCAGHLKLGLRRSYLLLLQCGARGHMIRRLAGWLLLRGAETMA